MACVMKYIAIVALSLTAAVTSSVIDENKCSKFDYEYRVLERIIFLENKNVELERKQLVLERKNEELGDRLKEQRLEFERVNKEQDQTQEELGNTVEKKDSDLKAELTRIVTNVEKLNATLEDKGQIIQENDRVHKEDRGKLLLAVSKLESDLKAEQSQIVRKMEQVHNEDNGKIWSAVKKLESGWPRENATHLSFSARLGHNKKYTSGETLVFKYIFNNDGDAYNANTGIFTAPVDGKYWFSASISVYYQAYANVFIMKNNDYTVRVYPDRRGSSNNNYETATVSTVMDLESGDTVYCRWHSGTTSTSYSVYNTHSNSFSGALLTQC